MEIRSLHLLEFEKIIDIVAGHSSSSMGKEYVYRMTPVRDAAVVRLRQAETSEARKMLSEISSPPFRGLHDVREHVLRAEKEGTLSALELLTIAETAACLRRLRRFFATAQAQVPLLYGQGKLLGEFSRVEQAIDHTISSAGEVLDSASPTLERARRRVRTLHQQVQNELQRLLTSASTQEQLQESIITQRNGRYCVPVRAESRNVFKGIVHDISASGQTAFMEPMAIVDIGNDLREAERQEEEEIQRVLAAISLQVGAVAKPFLSSLEAAARLDLIFARANYAQEIDAIPPVLNTDGIINLRAARHPLLGSIAVPIDIHLGEDVTHTLLITGPNTGGKTVTLKTVGLLTLMAQSGLHIPAEIGSQLAIVNEVFVDIGDEQSIEQSLSTFSGHMTNIIHILHEAAPNTLILLDEIGAGTDPAEGAALGKAVLLELYEHGCRTIATTHYGELKVFGQSTVGFVNASVEFDLETLRPTYRVITGLPGSSNALAISQRLGLSKAVVARAKGLMGESPQAMEQVLKQAEGVRRALDRERSAAARSRLEAEETALQLKTTQRELDEKRNTLLARARQQAQDIVQQSRLEVNALLDELKTALRSAHGLTLPISRQPNPPEMRKRADTVFSDINSRIATLPSNTVLATTPSNDRPALQKVVAGQAVLVRSLGHKGIALDTGRDDDEVEVQVGIMRVRVPVSDLEARIPIKREIPLPPSARIAHDVEKELLLLGKRAEEASEELQTYLFEALEGGLTQVRIVHGFGTGALRQVVQDVLRNHPAVRRFRLGQQGEGGSGVTIADLGMA